MRIFYDPLHNFISPVTGRIIIDPNYVLIGDKNGMSLPSPILIDIRLDLKNLRRDFNDLIDSSFVLNFPTEQLPNAQDLFSLNDGFMYNTAGIISTTPTIPITGLPDLTYKNLWIGDSNNRPVETPIITIDNLPNLGVGTVNIPNPFNPGNPIVLSRGKVWRGTDSTRPEESDAVTALEADVLLITGRFLTAAWILRNSGLVPRALRPLLWPNAQFLDDLPINRILSHTTEGTIGVMSLTQDHLWKGDGNNIPVEVLKIDLINLPDLTYNYFWVGDNNNRPIESNTLPPGSLPDLTYKYLWLGDTNNRPQESLLIYMDNLPNLTYKAIWRGNTGNRPEETQDLTILEAKVTYIQDVTIPAIEAQIEAIEGQIAAIEGEIAIIQGQITALEAAVAIIQGQIITIFATLGSYENRITALENQVTAILAAIAAINTRIDNLSVTLIGDVTGSGNLSAPITTTLQLTLDQIKIAQNTVNLNNQKIINLKSDNVEQQDALNAKFLWDLMHDQVEVIWV